MADRRRSSVFTVGALSCTTGIFLATIAGIFLCLPYVSLADPSQLGAFGVLHALIIFMSRCLAASLPFGLAALVAKYSSRNDWKTVTHIRLFASVALIAAAAVIAAILAFAADPLSRFIFAGAPVSYIETLRSVFYIAAALILLFAVLYLFRGFWQGMNEMVIDTRSQLIEQIAYILAAGGALAYIYFHQDSKNILLYLIFGACIFSVLLAIGYYVLFDKLKYPRIGSLAHNQLQLPVKKKKANSELFAFATPGFLVVFIQGLFLLTNIVFFIPLCQRNGMDANEAMKLFEAMTVNCAWLAEIPVLLAYLLSSGAIPEIIEGVETNNAMRIDRGVERILGRFIYAAAPFLFSVIMLAPQLYHIIYGDINAAENAMMLSWTMAEGVAVAFGMISSWMMISLRFHQNNVLYNAVGLIIKGLTMYFLMKYMGYAGAMASTIVAVLAVLFLCQSRISNYYGVSYQRLFLQTAKIAMACLCMNGVYALFKYFGLDGLNASRLLSVGHVALMLAVAVPVYLFVTGMMKVNVQLFGHRNRS